MRDPAHEWCGFITTASGHTPASSHVSRCLALRSHRSSFSNRVPNSDSDCRSSALASFSTHIHGWYPIFRPGFSEYYFSVISGPLIPSPETCMTLMATAIGLAASSSGNPGLDVFQTDRIHRPYFDAAIASLPIVLTDDSITSVQSLILLIIYYCCLSKPCHAHDYCQIASLKIQNLLQK
jgi:hypothetical protein